MLGFQERVGVFLLVYSVLDLTHSSSHMTERPEICKAVKCSLPPRGIACTETHSTNPKIEKRLGAQKDCCPVYHCRNATGEEFLFIGMNNKKKSSKLENNDAAGICENASCPVTEEFKATGCIDSTTPPIQVVEFTKGAHVCCPVKTCFTDDGSLKKIGFAMMEGRLSSQAKTNDGCDEFTCATKPSSKGSSCQAVSASIGIAEPLGSLKECCTVWECTYADESVFYHYWIQGSGFRYREVRSKPDTIHAEEGKRVATTERPHKYATKRNAHLRTKRPRSCAPGEVCPRIKAAECRSNSAWEETSKYIPAEEKCCPLTVCSEKRGFAKTHYAKLSGKIPTSESDIQKEKGVSKRVKCPKIKCADEPKMPGSKKQKCSVFAGPPIVPKIRPFSSCCSMFKCTQPDGSYSLEQGIHGSSFSYYEISFYNVPVGDKVPEENRKRKLKDLKDSDDESEEQHTDGESFTTIEKIVPGAINTARQIPAMNNIMTQPFLPI